MIKSSSLDNLHPLMDKIKGNKILDYRIRTRINQNLIPQYFNKRIVFQSFGSFQQNNRSLGKSIRKYIDIYLGTGAINALGGESYLYSSNLNTNFYTNSRSSLRDYEYNQYKFGNLIDYNRDKINLLPLDTIINLSKLNINILKQLNQINLSYHKLSYHKLIIINCHHKDFWKKIKFLSNYKLIVRKKFIDHSLKYFITVNILVPKCHQ